MKKEKNETQNLNMTKKNRIFARHFIDILNYK